MKKLVTALFFLVFFLGSFPFVLADVGTSISPNNKFGIHLAVVSEEDLKDAASLVNSGGGDWGYVTVVMEENDRNLEKWQAAFDLMRQLHLIPLVRLATKAEGDTWKRPTVEDVSQWVDFLDSLNWVVKNRYVVLFNEPNFNKEWGGKIEASDYGKIALELALKLKTKNPDFFVMLAGFNATAPDALPDYLSEENFLKNMVPEGEDFNSLFKNIDGWASHSYGTSTYLREINLLKNLGLTRDLPVLVTEAGWQHAEGINFRAGFYSEQTVTQNLLSFFNLIINDPQVVAVTPFILNYQGEPFDHFSWRKPVSLANKEFYPQYQATQDLAKIKGQPVQEQKLVLTSVLPGKLIKNSTYQIAIKVKNLGQAIWQQQDGYRLKFNQDPKGFEYLFSDFSSLAPDEVGTIFLSLKTKESLGKFDFSLGVSQEEKMVSNLISWPIEIVASLKFNLIVKAFPQRLISGNDFKILIYNDKQEILFQRSGVEVKNGQGELTGVNNLVVGEKYRMVILKSYFLPGQMIFTASEKKNNLTFKSLLPLDFNLDGRLSIDDLTALLKNPQLIRHILW